MVRNEKDTANTNTQHTWLSQPYHAIVSPVMGSLLMPYIRQVRRRRGTQMTGWRRGRRLGLIQRVYPFLLWDVLLTLAIEMRDYSLNKTA